MVEQSPLHRAVATSSIVQLGSLLDERAEIDSQDEQGRTPLHCAIAGCFKRGVELLLKKGSDVNIKDNLGYTALHLAVERKGLLLVDKILNKGGEIECRNKYDQTPLQLAVQYNFQSGVNFLLNRGAEVNVRDVSGSSPLHRAAVRSNQLVKTLLDRGAELDSKNEEGNTPLHMAALNDECEIVKELLQRAASVEVVNNTGQTPLDNAMKSHNCNGTLRTMMVHIIKLRTVNLVEDLKWNTNHFDFRFLHSLCLKELQKLKLKKFDQSSLYHIFSNSSDPLFVFNNRMEDAIKSAELESEFPIYAPILRASFEKAKQRYNLLSEAQEYFNIELPKELRRKVLSYLRDGDIKNVIQASEVDHV